MAIPFARIIVQLDYHKKEVKLIMMHLILTW